MVLLKTISIVYHRANIVNSTFPHSANNSVANGACEGMRKVL